MIIDLFITIANPPVLGSTIPLFCVMDAQVKRGCSCYLVVSCYQWGRRILVRPGILLWKRLVESPVSRSSNSHLQQSYEHVSRETFCSRVVMHVSTSPGGFSKLQSSTKTLRKQYRKVIILENIICFLVYFSKASTSALSLQYAFHWIRFDHEYQSFYSNSRAEYFVHHWLFASRLVFCPWHIS